MLQYKRFSKTVVAISSFIAKKEENNMMKLVFATSLYSISADHQSNMGKHNDINIFVQVNEVGTYLVNFNNDEVRFFEGMMLQEFTGNVVEVEFDEEKSLTPHDVCKNAEHHPCFTWVTNWEYEGCPIDELSERGVDKRWRVVVDYLKGKIESHSHEKEVREVYLSAEAPYFGKVCGYGKIHSSADIIHGDAKIIAIKVTPITRRAFIPSK